MARTDTLGNFLTDVADAIREKKGTNEEITASDFDTEIANLPSGGATATDTITIATAYTTRTDIQTLITNHELNYTDALSYYALEPLNKSSKYFTIAIAGNGVYRDVFSWSSVGNMWGSYSTTYLNPGDVIKRYVIRSTFE